ncbi:MAG: isoprenylcysteine carboxylmethyltransferase family protein [Pseudomonadota bacterium]
MKLLKYLDYPPIWLIAFMALAWGISEFHAPFGSAFLMTGAGIIFLGVALAIWAAVSFLMARTTIIPHRPPSALVDTGPFERMRNPIYLADLMILIGWSLAIGAPAALVLVPIFWWVLLKRFVLPEEARLEQHLGQPYLDYKSRVRRWI